MDVREVAEDVEKPASYSSLAPSSDFHQNTASVKDSSGDPVGTRPENPHGERPKRKTRPCRHAYGAQLPEWHRDAHEEPVLHRLISDRKAVLEEVELRHPST